MRRFFAALILLVAMSEVAASELENGDISGKIADPNGGVLADVNIRIKNTWRGAVSGPDGEFEIKSLAPGDYILELSHLSYEPFQVNVTVVESESLFLELQFARERAISLDEIVVTATRTERAPEKVPQPVAFISQAEIARRYEYNAGAMLDFVPGVRVIRRGATVGAGYGVAIRSLNGGQFSDKTLVLIDGRPLNNGWNGGVNFNALPSESVERVEVIKGPGSALYGSQATAGVINIFTKSADPGLHGWLSIAREFNGAEEIFDSAEEGYGRAEVGATNLQFNGSYGSTRSSHTFSAGYRISDQNYLTGNKNNWKNYDVKYDLQFRQSENSVYRLHVDVHNNDWRNEASNTPDSDEYTYLGAHLQLKHQKPRAVLHGQAYVNYINSKNESLSSAATTGANSLSR